MTNCVTTSSFVTINSGYLLMVKVFRLVENDLWETCFSKSLKLKIKGEGA